MGSFDTLSLSGAGFLGNNAYAVGNNSIGASDITNIGLDGQSGTQQVTGGDPLADFFTKSEGGTASGTIIPQDGSSNGASGSWNANSDSTLAGLQTASSVFGSGGGNSAIGGGTSSGSSKLGVFDAQFWVDLFMRGSVIILGLVFVALGLSMFSHGDTNAVVKVIDPTRPFRKLK